MDWNNRSHGLPGCVGMNWTNDDKIVDLEEWAQGTKGNKVRRTAGGSFVLLTATLIGAFVLVFFR